MAAGAPLIPEGAAGVALLADLFIGLLALLGFLVCAGILGAYEHTLGAVTKALVSALRHLPLGIGSVLAWPLAKIDNAIQTALSTGALSLEIVSGRFFHAAAVIVGWMVNYMLATAVTMERAIAYLIHLHLPRTVKWMIRAAFPLAWLTKLIAQEVRKLLPRVHHIATDAAHTATTVVYRYPRAIAARLTHVEALVHRLTVAVEHATGAIATTLPIDTPAVNWRGLTKRLARLERRMHRVEGLFAAGVLAVAMANVLGVTAKCLRSGNIGKVARRLCGLSPKALEGLLGLLADVLLLTNVCQVFTLLQEGLGLIQPEVTAFITATETWACYGDNEHPPSLGPIALDLPTVTGYALNV